MSSRGKSGATESGSVGGVLALLLAGSLRTARSAVLAKSLGIPVPALPIDARDSILSHWISRLARDGIARRVGVALAEESEAPLYRRLAEEAGFADRLDVWVDRNQHRGAAGTVRDYIDAAGVGSFEQGVLVVECSTTGRFELGDFVRAIDPASEATVLALEDGRPCGVIHLTSKAIGRIPSIGYFDVKEQLLPAIAAAGGSVPVVLSADVPHRLSDRRSYLDLIEDQSAAGAPMVSDSAQIEPSALVEGPTLLGRGVIVRARAVVSHSVVMPGAIIGAGAIVARSVVPPGARVPAGSRVIDQVYAPLAGAGRDAS